MVAPPACEPGQDTPMIFPRLDRLARGQPQLLAVRSPRATGLASSLSGCIRFTGQRCLFRHRRPGGRFSRVLPRPRVLPGTLALFVPPFGVFHWAAPRFPETSARVIRPCWCAVTTVCPLGNCDSLKLETGLNYFTQLTAVSHRGSLLVSSVACGTCDRARRTGESCLAGTEVPLEGPNQPAWSDLCPVTRVYPGRFQLSFSPTVLSMNCEQNSRNSESVNELICTGYSPETTARAGALRRLAINVRSVFHVSSLELFTSGAGRKKVP